MIRRPPGSILTDTLLPYSFLFRSDVQPHVVHLIVGGVDDMGGGKAQGAQQLPLARDPVCGRPIERQRVSAPRLGKAPLQFRSRAVEEEDADVHSLIDPQAIYPDRKSTRLNSSH